MVEIKPMDESYILWDCLHDGPVDPGIPVPGGHDTWVYASDLPPHPWSDETIAQLAKEYQRLSEGGEGDASVEFMREMIQRYGTCAMLAWENEKVVGFLRFYPLSIAQLLVRADSRKQHLVQETGAMAFEADPEALFVQCVMTARPFWGSERMEDGKGHTAPSMAEAGARKGLGLRLAAGLIPWAREHGWKRILKQAHPDLDYFYGQFGGGGKAFWTKAGFKVIGTLEHERYGYYLMDVIESQRKAKGMSKDEVWTWFLMAYEV
jgi:GNAT superfamily N-acetyltransferase